MPRILGDDPEGTVGRLKRLRDEWWTLYTGFTDTEDAAARYTALVDESRAFLELNIEQGYFLLNLTNPNCPETPETPLAKKAENRAREMDGLHTMLRISLLPPDRFWCFRGYDPAK